MDAERRHDALTGPATGIDRALQAALAIEPSPEFVARVRARIANQPAAPAWRWPRLVAAASLVAAAIAIAVAVSRPRETTMPVPVAQTLNPVQVGRPATMQSETLTPEERARETIGTQLRRAEGIDREQFQLQTGFDLGELAGPQMQRHVAGGLLVDDGRSVALTRDGVCVADSLIAELMTRQQ